MSGITSLFIGGIFLTLGDVVFKFWIERPHPWEYPVGLTLYVIGLIFLVHSYKTQNIAVASIIFVIINVVTLALLSWFYFDEKLSHIAMVGLLLAFVAIILLEL